MRMSDLENIKFKQKVFVMRGRTPWAKIISGARSSSAKKAVRLARGRASDTTRRIAVLEIAIAITDEFAATVRV
jgi:hypothetical protein